MKINKENYCQLFHLIGMDKLTRDEMYDCSNLYAYLMDGINYMDIKNRVEDVLAMVNERCPILSEIKVRLDMDIDNPKVLSLTTKEGRDLQGGDILNTHRTCKTGLPIFFTFYALKDGNNGKQYLTGRTQVGFMEYDPDDWYLVGRIKS